MFIFFLVTVSERHGLVVRVHDETTTTTPGNDAQLKCSINSELWKVALWTTDDGNIYQPFATDANECKLKLSLLIITEY